MTEPQYIELHAASAFSFLEGASQPEALIERAAEFEMPEMALMDRNGLYGAARFHIHAKEKKLTARIGAEISVSDFGFDRLRPPTWQPNQYRVEPPRIPVLCTSQAGYQNLSQLITRFKMRETIKTEGAATLHDMEEFAPGMIALTGGDEGPLAAALAAGGEAAACAAVQKMVNVFGQANVYVELQRHGERAEEARNQAALRIADSLRLPVLATNGVRYARGRRARDSGCLYEYSAWHEPGAGGAAALCELAACAALTADDVAACFMMCRRRLRTRCTWRSGLSSSWMTLGYAFPCYDVG